MSKYIYNSPLVEVAQTREEDRLGSQLAQAGILEGDSANVESIASEAADLRLEGVYRFGEEISTRLARELEELSDASISQLPLYRRGGDYANAGYYEIESADVSPVHPNQPAAWEYRLSLSSVGKRATHYRAVCMNPSDVTDRNPWSSGTGSGTVGLPSSARKVRWMHPETKATAIATPTGTVEAANTDVDRYGLDTEPLGTGRPSLVYDIDYADDVQGGARVYDTRGNVAKKSEAGIRQWQTVHSTRHDLDYVVVMSNGLLRLRIDAAAGTLEAEQWDPTLADSADSDSDGGITLTIDSADSDGGGAWDDVTLTQPTDIDLYDVDITSIGMVDVRAQLTFDVDGSLVALNASLQRGQEGVLLTIPRNESGPIPTALEDWLAPIASQTTVDARPAKTLVSRSDVNR